MAYESEDYYHTIRWMTVALEQAEIENDKGLVVQCLDYMAFSTAQVSNPWIYKIFF